MFFVYSSTHLSLCPNFIVVVGADLACHVVDIIEYPKYIHPVSSLVEISSITLAYAIRSYFHGMALHGVT